MNLRRTLWIVASGLILLGIFLPRGWYAPIPSPEPLPAPPFDGFVLLQAAFILEGLVLLLWGVRRKAYTPLTVEERLPFISPSEPNTGDLAKATALRILTLVTVIGLILRLIRLDSGLWIDEITPLLRYGDASLLQVVVTYVSSNNHLLTTLLVKIAVSALGSHNWVVRLPSVLFGIATIPILYWTARQAFSRRVSLGAAFLLAVSYQHVFFSQNARGYASYVLFSILASGFLVRALREDRLRDWGSYVLAMSFSFSSILISSYVFMGQVLAGGIALLALWRSGKSLWPLFKRLLVVFSLTGLLGLHLYASVLPQIYVYMKAVYMDPSAGFTFLSLEFLSEVTRGLFSGMGVLALAAAPIGLLVLALGFVSFLRKNWVLALALLLPCVIQIGFVVSRNLVASPRFFILMLPLAFLILAEGLFLMASKAVVVFRRNQKLVAPLFVTLLLLGGIALSIQLRNYYRVPKQAYLKSLEYIESIRQPDEIVVAIHLIKAGYLYYEPQVGLKEGEDIFHVRSVDALENVLALHEGQGTIMATTFPRALRMTLPDLDARIKGDWHVIQAFPATIGDGQIMVWRQKRERSVPIGN